MKKYLLLFLCLCMLCTTLVGCGKSNLEEAEDIVNNTQLDKGREHVTLNFYLMSEATVSTEVLAEMQSQFNKILDTKKYNTYVVFTILPAVLDPIEEASIPAATVGSVLADGTNVAANTKVADILVAVNNYAKEKNEAKADLFTSAALYMVDDITVGDLFAEDKIDTAKTTTVVNLLKQKITHGSFAGSTVLEVVNSANYSNVLAKRMADAEKNVGGSVAVEGVDYPALRNNQLDIFLNTSYDSLKTNVQNGNLSDLSSLLASKWRDFSNVKSEKEVVDAAGNSYKFNPTISEVLMSSSYFCTELYADDAATTAERSEIFYGVPCSYPVGQYKYLVVHKEYADRFFLADNFKEDISVLADKEKALEAKSKLEAEIKKLGENPLNYIKQVTGNYEDRVALKNDNSGNEYYVCVLEKPSISYEEICSAMFCVSKYTANLERAFEVLYELNVNPELHTILQYGAKDVTYTFDNKTQTITLKEDKADLYQMNLKYTGNYFCIYPLSGVGYQPLVNATKQNADATCKGVVVHQYYLSRENLGKYVFDMYDNNVSAYPPTAEGQNSFLVIPESNFVYQGKEYALTYRAIRSGTKPISTLVMEATVDDITFIVKVIAEKLDNGYSFMLEYEADGVTLVSTSAFATLPSSNKYEFTYTFQGMSQLYEGTLVVSPSDYNSGVKLSANKQTILIDGVTSPSIEQIQEIDASMNMVLSEFLSALDVFMNASNTKLTVSAFGFTLPEAE